MTVFRGLALLGVLLLTATLRTPSKLTLHRRLPNPEIQSTDDSSFPT